MKLAFWIRPTDAVMREATRDVDQAPAGCSGKVNTEQRHTNQQNRCHGCCRLRYDQRKGAAEQNIPAIMQILRLLIGAIPP